MLPAAVNNFVTQELIINLHFSWNSSVIFAKIEFFWKQLVMVHFCRKLMKKVSKILKLSQGASITRRCSHWYFLMYGKSQYGINSHTYRLIPWSESTLIGIHFMFLNSEMASRARWSVATGGSLTLESPNNTFLALTQSRSFAVEVFIPASDDAKTAQTKAASKSSDWFLDECIKVVPR